MARVDGAHTGGAIAGRPERWSRPTHRKPPGPGLMMVVSISRAISRATDFNPASLMWDGE
jgi:hypothetical protein